MILSGQLGPAEQIDANILTETLETGRTPVREALQRLQTQGIVRIVPKRGVQIVTLTADELMEIYQVVSALEIEAVRLLATSNISPGGLADLTKHADALIAVEKTEDREAWILADDAFHRALLRNNPNRRLLDAGMLHRDLAQRAHFVASRMLDQPNFRKSALAHQDLIRLIAKGDVEAACANHQTQRQRGAELLVSVVRRFGLKQL